MKKDWTPERRTVTRTRRNQRPRASDGQGPCSPVQQGTASTRQPWSARWPDAVADGGHSLLHISRASRAYILGGS